MIGPVPSLNLILYAVDHTLHHKLERDFKKRCVPAAITVAKSMASLQRATAKRTFDGLVLETKRGARVDLGKIQRLVDPSRTFILAGSRERLLQTTRAMLAPVQGTGHNGVSITADGSLEGYFESKFADFVRGMKHGSASDLHPMLIKTVERPLISHALRVTNGNQVKTAHLLGMNRNTLRKKIGELRIPVNRERSRRSSERVPAHREHDAVVPRDL